MSITFCVLPPPRPPRFRFPRRPRRPRPPCRPHCPRPIAIRDPY